MRMSRNPVFRRVERNTYINDQPITYASVAMKSIFLIGLVFISAFLTYEYGGEFLSLEVLIGTMVLAFICVIVGTRSVRLSPIFSSLYAICEGVFLAIISAIYASFYEGIVPTALITTSMVFLIMLLLYSTRVIKVTQRFASIMVVMLITVIIMGLLSFVLPFASSSFYYIYVIFSAGLSAFFLLMDFARIETLVESGADAKYGWVLSLGLLVTLVWIYVEMLRLLAIVSRRN